MNANSASHAGSLLLALSFQDEQTAEELAQRGRLGGEETISQIERLIDLGFVVEIRPESAQAPRYRLVGKYTSRPETPRRILLVDDSDSIRRLVSLLLEDAGHVVVATSFPDRAVQLLGAVDFDLVITDSYAAGGDLLGGTSQIVTAAGKIPVALFSAHHMDMPAAQRAGFRDVIAKPFDIDRLERQVRQLLDDSAAP